MSRVAVLLVLPALVLALLTFPFADGQIVDEPGLLAQLEQLFPDAATFSAERQPARLQGVRRRCVGTRAEAARVRVLDHRAELLERGFDGPIKMLVGMSTEGLLTGVIVTEHHEPYGYFSVEPPEFAAQFKGKNIRDPFKVGADVDAVARATITITSSSRAIRNASRRIARAYLTPASPPSQ